MSRPDARDLLILGAGGAAREIAGFARECDPPLFPVAFVDADEAPRPSTRLVDLPVLNLGEAAATFPGALAIVAVGSGVLRRRLAKDLARAGLKVATLVHRSVHIGPRVTVGEGTILAPGVVITTDVRIGRHVYINIGCTVSHDTVIDDFVTVSPGVSIPGAVHLEEGAFIGSGASLVNGRAGALLRIGRDAVVGAGSCVTRNVAPNMTVVGSPAKPLAVSGVRG